MEELVFSRKSLCIINMYRVLLKVDKVNIRIKQAVHLHIIIKKRQEYFTHCKHQVLVNGQLALYHTSEFFVSAKDPCFEIEIYLLTGTLKKKGGNVELNLSNYTLSASNRIVAPIQNTPLHNSSLLIDITYMPSELPANNRLLVSLNQLQDIQHKRYLQELVEEGRQLAKANQQLNAQIFHLKEKNEGLLVESQEMEQESIKRENTFKTEIQKMEEEKAYNYNTLVDEKKRIAEIVDIINETGDPYLINQMGDIINKEQ